MKEIKRHLSVPLKKNEIETIKEFKKYLQKHFPENSWKLFLFGSKARGDYSRHSDTDVALILNGMTREIKKNLIDKICDFEIKHDAFISLLTFSKEEFDRLKKREKRIALDIEKEGIPL